MLVLNFSLSNIQILKLLFWHNTDKSAENVDKII